MYIIPSTYAGVSTFFCKPVWPKLKVFRVRVCDFSKFRGILVNIASFNCLKVSTTEIELFIFQEFPGLELQEGSIGHYIEFRV